MGQFSPVLLVHISAGMVALVAGFGAMALRKGSRRHRLAGNVFFISMLCMSAGGAILAFMRPDALSVCNAILTFYLVATGWIAATRRGGETGMIDWGALLIVLAVLGGLVTNGLAAANSQSGSKDGYPALAYFIFAFVALLAVAGDVRKLGRGGVYGAQRIARHLWRMSFALFIAAGSFFLGQQKVMPASIRGAKILFVPPVLVLVLTIFWLVRVKYSRVFKSSVSPHSTPKTLAALRGQTFPR